MKLSVLGLNGYLHFIKSFHKVVIDLIRNDRVVLVGGMFDDKVSDPSGRSAKFPYQEGS